MASLTPILPSVNNASSLSSTSAISNTSNSLPILKKKSLAAASKHGRPSHYYASRVACKATNGDNQNPISYSHDEQEAHLGMFDRRNVLLGLGGLYGAASTLSNNPFALAVGDGSDPRPIEAPNLATCHKPTGLPPGARSNLRTCCPPIPPESTPILTFEQHLAYTDNSKLRTRRPAHTLANDPAYLRKFERAIQLMKDLPPTDPRSFVQQANIHCAYCNGGYPQSPCTSSDNDLQVHFSWLFAPFHRLYLYFFEKILGELIGEPDFAMPFWNWDHPDGMHMPRVYTDNIRSPLFDRYRNPKHLAPTTIDLNFSRGIGDIPQNDLERFNLRLMHRQMMHNNNPELFLGQCYREGSTSARSGSGALELLPHNTVHAWVGDPEMPNGEDLGNFYSSGYDPLFYAHHSNVDRLWSVWKTLEGDFRKDFTCKDWLNAAFIFYDHKGNPVKVNVANSLDTNILGYNYQAVDNLWASLNFKPTPRLAPKSSNAARPAAPTAEGTQFPVILDSVKKFYVRRPTDKPGPNQNVILLIEGIEFYSVDSVKFDVLLNDEDDASCTPDNTEYANSFTNVSHGNPNELIKSRLRTNITEMLEDLKVSDDDEYVLVTLVPRYAGQRITIGSITIALEDSTTELTCLPDFVPIVN